MFGFAEWDSPIALILEGLLSIAIVVGLFFVARRVNAQANADRERYLHARNNASASESSSAIPAMSVQPDENEAESKQDPKVRGVS